MHKLYWSALLLLPCIICGIVQSPVGAIAPGSVLISQVQLGSPDSNTDEFIEIYNNTAVDVEITDLCLNYASAASKVFGNKLTCFLSTKDNVHVFLPSYSSAFAISKAMSIARPELGSDAIFSSSLSGDAGHIRLVESGITEIDKLGWGDAVLADGGLSVDAPQEGEVLGRKAVELGILQDTNDNSADFYSVLPRTTYPYGSIYELEDVCSNIEGIQTKPPDGYIVNASGACVLPPKDICSNIEGTQSIMPEGLVFDKDGNCIKYDACPNLAGVQTEAPSGFELSQDGVCISVLLPLRITELLPNAVGSDDGNEYIEIFNPNDVEIDLAYYVIYIGLNADHFYSFPLGARIGAGEYAVFSNDDIKFTLINTASKVQLKIIDGTIVDSTLDYLGPDEGIAWALIDGIWQYTNRPTKADINLPSLIEDVVDVVNNDGLTSCEPNQFRNPVTNRCNLIIQTTSELVPCKDGQYRSEETNRCRNIVSDMADLVPCAEGQERNPDTNRCRNIAADIAALVPCAENQERNPATNRCRSVSAVLGSSDLKPCAANQERNPDTNRCRNIVSSVPSADFKPEQTFEDSNNNIVYWSLAAVGSAALGYGVWEWRTEVGKLVRKMFKRK